MPVPTNNGDGNGRRETKRQPPSMIHWILTLFLVMVTFVMATLRCGMSFASRSLPPEPFESQAPFVVSAAAKTLTSRAESLPRETGRSANAAAPITGEQPSPGGPQHPVIWIEEEPYNVHDGSWVDTKGMHSLRVVGQDKDQQNANAIMCARHRFDESRMPKASVIVTAHNEVDGFLSLSVHSILARTPPALLEDIVVVDDNSEGRAGVNKTEYSELQKLSPKIKIIYNQKQMGCAGSRMVGARAAKGEVLVFQDAHIEQMHLTWYQHLVAPIVENPRTLSVQTGDILSDIPPFKREYGPSGKDIVYISSKLDIWYAGKRFFGTPQEQENNGWEPYETPIFPGSLFAMRADEFWRLGGYDKGLQVWGAEHVELSLKTWMCGGRIVYVPCSRVGHVYKTHSQQELGGKDRGYQVSRRTIKETGIDAEGKWLIEGLESTMKMRSIVSNNLRVLHVWVGNDPAMDGYYNTVFNSTNLAPEWQKVVDSFANDEYIQEQLQLKNENQCHDFAWFDRHVMMKILGIHHPWHPSQTVVNCGSYRAKDCSSCHYDQPSGSGCGGDCMYCKEKMKCYAPTDEANIKRCPSLAMEVFGKVEIPGK